MRKIYKVIQTEGVTQLVRYGLYYIKTFTLAPFFFFKIKNTGPFNNLDELMCFAYNTYGGFIRPQQNKKSSSILLTKLQKVNPRYLMEIGTAFGGMLFLLTRVASKDACIISLDIGNLGLRGGYPVWKSPIYKSFAIWNQKIHLLRMDSHANKSLEQVKALLGNNKLDFLFIDGDHTYEGVKKDFEMYSPLVNNGGLIVFHDIYLYRHNYGISKYWNELKSKYMCSEIESEFGLLNMDNSVCLRNKGAL